MKRRLAVASVGAVAVISGIVAGGALVAAGATSEPPAAPPGAPSSQGPPFPLDMARAIAQGTVGTAQFVVAPKEGASGVGELCFSVVMSKSWLFGCSDADQMASEGMIYVEHSPSTTHVWGFSPYDAVSVSAGAAVVATPNGRFFDADVPEGTTRVTLEKRDGTTTTMRVAPRPSAE